MPDDKTKNAGEWQPQFLQARDPKADKTFVGKAADLLRDLAYGIGDTIIPKRIELEPAPDDAVKHEGEYQPLSKDDYLAAYRLFKSTLVASPLREKTKTLWEHEIMKHRLDSAFAKTPREKKKKMQRMLVEYMLMRKELGSDAEIEADMKKLADSLEQHDVTVVNRYMSRYGDPNKTMRGTAAEVRQVIDDYAREHSEEAEMDIASYRTYVENLIWHEPSTDTVEHALKLVEKDKEQPVCAYVFSAVANYRLFHKTGETGYLRTAMDHISDAMRRSTSEEERTSNIRPHFDHIARDYAELLKI